MTNNIIEHISTQLSENCRYVYKYNKLPVFSSGYKGNRHLTTKTYNISKITWWIFFSRIRYLGYRSRSIHADGIMDTIRVDINTFPCFLNTTGYLRIYLNY